MQVQVQLKVQVEVQVQIQLQMQTQVQTQVQTHVQIQVQVQWSRCRRSRLNCSPVVMMLLMISSTVRMKSAYTVCSAASWPGEVRGVAPRKGVAAEGVSAEGVPPFLARLPMR